MSLSLPPSTATAHARPGRVGGLCRAPNAPTWARLAVVAAILAASGGSRVWQERRVGRVMEQGRSSPFALAELPMAIGPWQGRETSLDPKIVRISGSSDLIARHYVDQRTGVGLDVVVLYGPTAEVSPHTPEVCYPAAGFEPMPGVFERPIPLRESAGGRSVPFRSLAFTKGEGGLADSQEVYYSLRYDGRWTTRSASPKASRRIPGMYKVQVSRRLAGRERRDVDNPCEPFLAALVGQIEARMGGEPPASVAMDD